jgi:hypothetical protein
MSDTAKMAKRHVLPLYGCLCLLGLGLGFGQSADAQQKSLATLLQENHYPLTVQNGTLAGPGAAFLRKEIAAAQFVAIGEEHGTREVPEFVWALCRAMAQDGGLDAMAIEAGPLVAARLQRWTAESDGDTHLSAFEKQNPDSIAFFNWRQEFDLLSHCQQGTVPHTLRLWGLDQEFLGAPQFILQQIMQTLTQGPAESIAQKLADQCALDTQKAIASGSWKDGCMLRMSPTDLADLQSALQLAENPGALALTAALIKTQHIYGAHESEHQYEANRERSLLMKHNFLGQYQQLSATTGKAPRVLLKFGGNHLFKGFNETDLNDLGNFVTEFADGLGSNSLHIEVLGIRGEEEAQFGPGQADRAVAKDSAPGPLAPLYAKAYQREWTVYDLRPLRSRFDGFGRVNRDLERLIFGYDILVLIPQVTAQDSIR